MRDTFTNLTDQPVGVIFTHRLAVDRAQVKQAYLAGWSVSPPITRPLKTNPTAFAGLDKLGIGLVALDDVLIVQSQGGCTNEGLSLGSREFALGANASYTVEWAVYVNGSGDYYDLVNDLRADEGRNSTTVQGTWVSPGQLMSKRTLDYVPPQSYFDVRRPGYFCIPCLSWSTDDPTVSLEGIEFIAYPQERAAVRRVIDAVAASRPHLKTMFHIAPNLYATNQPDQLWPDSRLIGPDGKQTVYAYNYESSTYFTKERLAENWRWWSYYPAVDNAYGRALLDSVDVMMDEMGVSGVFVDGALWDYGGGYSYDRFDGHTADIDPQTKTITRLKTAVPLLQQHAIAAWGRKIMDRGGVVVANNAVPTRTFAGQPFIFDKEVTEGPEMHLLPTPCTLGNPAAIQSETDVYADILAKLAWGNLYFYYGEPLGLQHELPPARMYPITVTDVRSGCVTGQERVVTALDGVYGWPGETLPAPGLSLRPPRPAHRPRFRHHHRLRRRSHRRGPGRPRNGDRGQAAGHGRVGRAGQRHRHPLRRAGHRRVHARQRAGADHRARRQDPRSATGRRAEADHSTRCRRLIIRAPDPSFPAKIVRAFWKQAGSDFAPLCHLPVMKVAYPARANAAGHVSCLIRLALTWNSDCPDNSMARTNEEARLLRKAGLLELLAGTCRNRLLIFLPPFSCQHFACGAPTARTGLARCSVLPRPVGGGAALQVPSQVVGTFDVAVGGVQFHAPQFLQVRPLGVDEQLVHGGNGDVADQAQIDAHPHAGQQLHRLFAADRLGGAQQAVRAAHAVVQFPAALVDQVLASLALVLDQRGRHVTDLLHQLGFRLAQRDLIADLVKVPHRLGAFAVQTPHGQADLVQAAEDLFDLARENQRGQVQHHAHPHPGAHVGRAGGQVAQAFVEGVIDVFFQRVIDAIDLLPRAGQVQAAVHHLDPQMVLLVDHQAELLVGVDHHAPAPSESACSRLINWRSTRNCRSTSGKPLTSQ